jgi:predicted dienelactone hydrolase
MNHLINESRHIPDLPPQLTLSISPIGITIEGRATQLELRITLPAKGNNIPIILLSHGHGPSFYLPSKDGYGPLVNYYAEQGFAVIQPTHANSKVAGLDDNHPDAPLFLNERMLEMTSILDNLEKLENEYPYLTGRLDKSKIAVVGHSAGSMTAAMLLGMQLSSNFISTSSLTPPKNHLDSRIKVGVLMAPVGKGEDLHDSIRQKFPDLNPDYSTMTTRNLVVYGDDDTSPHFTDRGADWHADSFYLSKGSDYLLSLIGGKHGLGGVAGYDAKETDDEDPDRLAISQKMSAAYIKSALYDDERIWQEARDALHSFASKHAHVKRK